MAGCRRKDIQRSESGNSAMIKVHKEGNWTLVENKIKGMENEIRDSVKDASEEVPEQYKKKISQELERWNVAPTNGFSSKEYTEQIKKFSEKQGGGVTVFVGMDESAPEDIKSFALNAEFEQQQHMGIWRKTTARFLDDYDKMREVYWNNLTAWEKHRRKKVY